MSEFLESTRRPYMIRSLITIDSCPDYKSIKRGSDCIINSFTDRRTYHLSTREIGDGRVTGGGGDYSGSDTTTLPEKEPWGLGECSVVGETN